MAGVGGGGGTGRGGFARLWALLLVTYVCVKISYDLLVTGYIDVRFSALLQLGVVPTAQAVVFWAVTRRAR